MGSKIRVVAENSLEKLEREIKRIIKENEIKDPKITYSARIEFDEGEVFSE